MPGRHWPQRRGQDDLDAHLGGPGPAQPRASAVPGAAPGAAVGPGTGPAYRLHEPKSPRGVRLYGAGCGGHGALPVPGPAAGVAARRLGGGGRGHGSHGRRPPAGPAHHGAFRRRTAAGVLGAGPDRKSTRLNSSHVKISYAVVCLKKKKEELTKMQLDNQKEIAEMQNEAQKEIAGIQSATTRQNTKDAVSAMNEQLA